VDWLGFWDATEDALLATFCEIIAVKLDDGVSSDMKGLRLMPLVAHCFAMEPVGGANALNLWIRQSATQSL
jgi:hypothetical protein